MTVITRGVGRRGRVRVPGGPILVLVVTGLVGFLFIGQLRGTQHFRQRLEAQSEGDLTRILSNLTSQADALSAETTSLRLQIAGLEVNSRTTAQAEQSAREQLQALEVLAGTVAVTGPGLILDIDDPRASVGYDALLDVIQELRDAGAEALAVNGRRVGVASALAEQDGGIALDGADLAAPYRVAAIGSPETLESGLKIPGGAIDALGALKGVSTSTKRSPKVDIPALEKAPAFKVARPVTSPG